MKENIYSINTPTLLVIKPLLFITGSLLISLVLPAQHQSAHNIRNVKPNFSNNKVTIPGSVTTVKTLSVLNSVAPGENSVSANNTDNRSDIYSPSTRLTTNNARIIGNTGYPGKDRSVNNVGSINNDGTINHDGKFNNVGTLNNDGSVNYIGSTNAVNSGNLLLSNSSARLSSFTGRSVNGEYNISWETVLESDIKQYEVEYSVNNKDFQGAGIVIASSKPAYTFNHTADAHIIMYYRLKVIDTRGGVSYTNPIMVKSTMAKAADLVTPTIIRDGVLNITITNAYKNVQLFNSAGIEVFREYLGGRTGNRIGFNLPTLPAGAYFVKLIGTNTSITQRVMIM